MVRLLLGALALAGLLSAAVAQDTVDPVDQDGLAPETTSPMDAPLEPANGMTDLGAGPGPMLMAEGYRPVESDTLVTRIVGATVYTSGAADAASIGTINDIVLSQSGEVAAVVIGVGGFLGIGEKNVAIAFADLRWILSDNGERRFALPTTPEALAAAPAFAWDDAAIAAIDAEEQQLDTTTNTGSINPALTTDQAPGGQQVDRASLADFDETTLRAEELLGIGVYGVDDEQIGTIGDLIFTTDGNIDALLIDVGGFLGIGQKEVAVGFENLAFSTDIDGTRYLFLNAKRDQLEAQPAFDKAAYAADRETQRLVVSQ